MKWSIVILFVLGLVAAGSAALLVMTLQVKPGSKAAQAPTKEMTVLVAAKNIEPMTLVTADSCVEKKIASNQLPAGALGNSTQIIGKVLATPMIEGQAFTKNCFAMEGSGLSLAAVLPEGKRAYSMSLSNSAGMAGLLYPGAVVDVLVAYRVASEEDQGGSKSDALSKVLVEGLQVIAVEDTTIMSDGKPKASNDRNSRGMVTLAVTPEQAQYLQLAVQNGQVWLAMRNPMDRTQVSAKPTMLSALTLNGEVPPQENGLLVVPEATPTTMPDRPQAVKPPAKWEVTILRGSAVETRAFKQPVEAGQLAQPQ